MAERKVRVVGLLPSVSFRECGFSLFPSTSRLCRCACRFSVSDEPKKASVMIVRSSMYQAIR